MEGPFKVRLATGVAPFAKASGGSPAALDSVTIDVQGRTLVVRSIRSSWSGYPGEAKGPVEVSIGTHALQYGTGAFAGVRGYLDTDGKTINIFRLPEHAARLLRSALRQWRGSALTGVSEHLADAEAPRLEEARIAALESRIEADLALGRHAQLLPELTRLVHQYPLQERFRAQLMTTFYRCDRQADALDAYARLRDGELSARAVVVPHGW